MASTAPLLTAAQMARIERHLPAKRRDPDVISAILFRRWSGAGLRPTATWYGVTFGRLQTWETQLRASGQLATIMSPPLKDLASTTRLGSIRAAPALRSATIRPNPISWSARTEATISSIYRRTKPIPW